MKAKVVIYTGRNHSGMDHRPAGKFQQFWGIYLNGKHFTLLRTPWLRNKYQRYAGNPVNHWNIV